MVITVIGFSNSAIEFQISSYPATPPGKTYRLEAFASGDGGDGGGSWDNPDGNPVTFSLNGCLNSGEYSASAELIDTDDSSVVDSDQISGDAWDGHYPHNVDAANAEQVFNGTSGSCSGDLTYAEIVAANGAKGWLDNSCTAPPGGSPGVFFKFTPEKGGAYKFTSPEGYGVSLSSGADWYADNCVDITEAEGEGPYEQVMIVPQGQEVVFYIQSTKIDEETGCWVRGTASTEWERIQPNAIYCNASLGGTGPAVPFLFDITTGKFASFYGLHSTSTTWLSPNSKWFFSIRNCIGRYNTETAEADLSFCTGFGASRAVYAVFDTTVIMSGEGMTGVGACDIETYDQLTDDGFSGTIIGQTDAYFFTVGDGGSGSTIFRKYDYLCTLVDSHTFLSTDPVTIGNLSSFAVPRTGSIIAATLTGNAPGFYFLDTSTWTLSAGITDGETPDLIPIAIKGEFTDDGNAFYAFYRFDVSGQQYQRLARIIRTSMPGGGYTPQITDLREWTINDFAAAPDDELPIEYVRYNPFDANLWAWRGTGNSGYRGKYLLFDSTDISDIEWRNGTLYDPPTMWDGWGITDSSRDLLFIRPSSTPDSSSSSSGSSQSSSGSGTSSSSVGPTSSSSSSSSNGGPPDPGSSSSSSSLSPQSSGSSSSQSSLSSGGGPISSSSSANCCIDITAGGGFGTAQVCGLVETQDTEPVWHIYDQSGEVSIDGWYLVTDGSDSGSADIGAPVGAAGGTYSVEYVNVPASGGNPGHSKVYCVIVTGASISSSSSQSSESSSSMAYCGPIEVPYDGCEWAVARLWRPDFAPSERFVAVVYLLDETDFHDHVVGAPSPQKYYIAAYFPADTGYLDVLVYETPPKKSSTQEYSLFAEYYEDAEQGLGDYLGASCILPYAFDPDHCADGGDSQNKRQTPANKTCS